MCHEGVRSYLDALREQDIAAWKTREWRPVFDGFGEDQYLQPFVYVAGTPTEAVDPSGQWRLIPGGTFNYRADEGICHDFMAEPFHRFREPERQRVREFIEHFLSQYHQFATHTPTRGARAMRLYQKNALTPIEAAAARRKECRIVTAIDYKKHGSLKA